MVKRHLLGDRTINHSLNLWCACVCMSVWGKKSFENSEFRKIHREGSYLEERGLAFLEAPYIFCLQNHSFQRAIIYLLESPRTFSSGPSGWSSPSSSQRRIACWICTEYREFMMSTKSKDISLAVTKKRINLEFSWLLSTTSPKCCFIHCFNIYFIIKLEFKK